MKRKVAFVLLIALVAVVAVATAVSVHKSDKTGKSGTSNSKQPASSFKQYDACKIFTEADAKAVMGSSAVRANNTPPAVGNDIQVGDCSYTNNAKDLRVITITVRSPRTQPGVDSNRALLGQRPDTAQDVNGYGQGAFWDPDSHQFVILKDDNWISIIYGGNNPAYNTLDEAKLVADKILAKL